MKSKLALLSVCLSLALASSVFATDVVVAPNAQESLPGNGQSTDPFRSYGTGGSRFQQVYDSFLFSGFGQAELITSVAFRPKQATFLTFIGNSLTISAISVQLSTTNRVDTLTAANGLSNVFANNIGADVTTVYSGALTLTATPSGNLSTPYAFDYVINFTTPFLYDRTKGNLLLDILIPDNALVSGTGSIGFRQIDTITDDFPSADGVATARGASGSATIGSNSTLGVVTKFAGSAAAVPDMGSVLALLVPALAGMVAMQRRLRLAAVRS